MARIDAKSDRTVTVTDDMGRQLEKFAFDMKGIRSVKGMLQGLWALNPFSQGLSGRNGFSDVDAHCEIDGWSLVLEFKQSMRSMNQGQVMKAIRQAKYQRTCTWFIEGETNKPTKILQVNGGTVEGEVQVTELAYTDIERLRTSIKRWEEWARSNSLVKGDKTAEWEQVNLVLKQSREVI